MDAGRGAHHARAHSLGFRASSPLPRRRRDTAAPADAAAASRRPNRRPRAARAMPRAPRRRASALATLAPALTALLVLAAAPRVAAVTTEVPVTREARALITVVPDFK